MTDRTTIGGIVYETLGSSNSNLLLKCNGTARIQWGSKLIDLIKDGKIASGASSSEQIYVVSSESEIRSDGIYVVSSDSTTDLFICKNGTHYNLSGTDLYISAINKQNLTAEQKYQALTNLGLCYPTLVEAKESGIQNGLVYITSTDQLYTIHEGVFKEFQATLQTVAVEQEIEEKGDIINSSFQIVLSIDNLEQLVISNGRIYSNSPIYVKDSSFICSEQHSDNSGYKIYTEKGIANIDSDVLTARNSVYTSQLLSSKPIVSNNNSEIVVSDDNITKNGFALYVKDDKSYLDIDYVNAREWSPFIKGMIMMFDGQSEIPEGWAICDGKEHEYKGIITTTPNLIGKFIKAAEASGTTGGNNEITISASNLPEHSHPHNSHSHTISGTTVTVDSSSDLTLESTKAFISDESISTTQVLSGLEGTSMSVLHSENLTSETVTSAGGTHSHQASITEGTITDTQSTEQTQQWDNIPINIEPEYYALIFIIKL
jgi:microcystin-dependent protein